MMRVLSRACLVDCGRAPYVIRTCDCQRSGRSRCCQGSAWDRVVVCLCEGQIWQPERLLEAPHSTWLRLAGR
ncbi:hypothetical protein TcWFU_003203 [Taenia crassiceps]|uniref:Uncharacterized protein n=1 Tax=Taenia crassiceps TaxID=6207 RepID=A0ABR4Q693_9CEST